ncbi:TPA: hypothetical protein ACSQIM_000525 [Clostridium perfringens]|uniref:hypothetical protein n=1 Tax=Clostridium perfringens TaxID=1502 RepID=UPI00189B57D7|nr:hypothetical protein [Clostridium perfringens]EHK2307034.1 hypothetical protein [Clostridium perfringens]EJT6473934.1 hypothetical protein [Clostridium perfringens]EJT6479461.1 hypothetical protein [Clostridium perfringens]EJT6530718.1 hypothetical protein [Clostridium perfringens]MCX0398754.1 hypothetical protein [Clostridium perfringens]
MKNKKRLSEIILFKRREHKNFIKRKKQLRRKKKRKKTTNLIKFLKDKNFIKKRKIRKIRKNKNHIKIPKNFSLIQNPDESIKTLKEIFYIGLNQKVQDIYIEHQNLANLDICASTIMDVIIMEIEKFRKNIIGNDFSISGVVDCNEKIKEMLEVSGILKHLKFKVEVPEHIHKLELIECEEQGIVSTKVTDYINECLKEHEFELSREGYGYFSEMVGEVIDNCKIHGGKFTKWYTLGHYSMKNDIGECSLVIFNFGDTIYENLKYGKITEETKQSLEKMTKYYEDQFDKNLWSEETLWTLYSLQDGVSRFRDSKISPDRGTGTVTFIDSFQKIGKTINKKKPLMSITSGKVSILFDGKYSLKVSDKKNEDRKIIAFNKENDLYKLPDENNVRALKNGFPGTVISMNFYLDKKYLINIMEEN